MYVISTLENVKCLMFDVLQMGLLDDLSGDEDDFAALSSRHGGQADDSSRPTQASGADFFTSDPTSGVKGHEDLLGGVFGGPVNSGDGLRVGGGGGGGSGGVDLLNMNNVNSNSNPQPDVVADQFSGLGLDIGGGGGGGSAPRSAQASPIPQQTATNVDLLAGSAVFTSTPSSSSSSKAPDLMGGASDDFDPFQQFATPTPTPASAPKAGKAASSGTFDPFGTSQVSVNNHLLIYCVYLWSRSCFQCPTRNRHCCSHFGLKSHPEFIAQTLSFLKLRDYHHIFIIVVNM
jgi:hypothetical protein